LLAETLELNAERQMLATEKLIRPVILRRPLEDRALYRSGSL
jgi:hypothetical protein